MTYPRIRAQRLRAWDKDSPYVCVVCDKAGKGGKPVADPQGWVRTFTDAESAKKYGAELVEGRVWA